MTGLCPPAPRLDRRKRALDIALSLAALAITSPICLAVGILLWLEARLHNFRTAAPRSLSSECGSTNFASFTLWPETPDPE